MNFAPKDLLQFVAFQSTYGQSLLNEHGIETDRLDTVILIDQNGVNTHSDGFIRIISKMPKRETGCILACIYPKDDT